MKNLTISAFTLALVAIVGLQFCSDAHAAFGIVSVVGGTELSPGAAVGLNLNPGLTQQTVDSTFTGKPIIFPEVLNAPLPSGGLAVDHDGSDVVVPIAVSNGVVSPALKDTVLTGGNYSSYFLHFDPAPYMIAPGVPVLFGNYFTEITFSQKIIGVQLFGAAANLVKGGPYTGTLDAGDLIAGLTGVTYPTNGIIGFRGLEEDFFLLGINGTKAFIAGSVAGLEIDQVRFIVAAVPELSSVAVWSVLTLAGVGIGYVKSRRSPLGA